MDPLESLKDPGGLVAWASHQWSHFTEQYYAFLWLGVGICLLLLFLKPHLSQAWRARKRRQASLAATPARPDYDEELRVRRLLQQQQVEEEAKRVAERKKEQERIRRQQKLGLIPKDKPLAQEHNPLAPTTSTSRFRPSSSCGKGKRG
ncbi:hypothetical protein QOT17_010026 [Balamuthia mandrillaris]